MVNSFSHATFFIGVLHSSYCSFSKETRGNDWAPKWKAVFQQPYAKTMEQILWLETSNPMGGRNHPLAAEPLKLPPEAPNWRGFSRSNVKCKSQQVLWTKELGLLTVVCCIWIALPLSWGKTVLLQPSEHSRPPSASAFLLLLHCSKSDSKPMNAWTHLNFLVMWEKNSAFLCATVGFREIGSKKNNGN